MREHRHTLNGGFAGAPTAATPCRRASYNVAETAIGEQNTGNSWYSSPSNVGTNYKNNGNVFRPVAALGEWEQFRMSVGEAYQDCLRHKLTTPQAMEYIPTAHEDVPLLAKEMWTNTYKPTTSTCFMVTFPKLREVFAAAFRDRIVHHWIHARISPVYEMYVNKMGNVTHACRKGFGNKTAIEQVENAMRNISRNYKSPAWVYRGDIVSFFMSIDKHIMLKSVTKMVKANKHLWRDWEYEILLRLVEIVVMHTPHKDCIVNSDISLWQSINPSKSMFYIPESKSMPIGNLTTQLFAGVYLLKFIWYMENRFRYYFGAYWMLYVSLTISVDDFVMVCNDKYKLKKLIKEAETFLRNELLLECHTEKTYFQPVSHGVKFLGKWIKPHRKYIINRTKDRFMAKVRESARLAKRPITPIGIDSIRASLNSYLGILKGTRSRRFIDRAFSGVSDEWRKIFEFNDNKVIVKK